MLVFPLGQLTSNRSTTLFYAIEQSDRTVEGFKVQVARSAADKPTRRQRVDRLREFISVGNAKEYPAQPASGRQR